MDICITCVAIVKIFDLKPDVPLIALAPPTLQSKTQQGCFAVEMGGAWVSTTRQLPRRFTNKRINIITDTYEYMV